MTAMPVKRANTAKLTNSPPSPMYAMLVIGAIQVPQSQVHHRQTMLTMESVHSITLVRQTQGMEWCASQVLTTTSTPLRLLLTVPQPLMENTPTLWLGMVTL